MQDSKRGFVFKLGIGRRNGRSQSLLFLDFSANCHHYNVRSAI